MDFKPSKLTSKLVSPFCPNSTPKSQPWSRPDITKKILTLRKKPTFQRKKSQESLIQSNIEINSKGRPRQVTIDYARRSEKIPTVILRTSKEKSNLNYKPSSTGPQNFSHKPITDNPGISKICPTVQSRIGKPIKFFQPLTT
jgi:hypothetical protein